MSYSYSPYFNGYLDVNRNVDRSRGYPYKPGTHRKTVYNRPHTSAVLVP